MFVILLHICLFSFMNPLALEIWLYILLGNSYAIISHDSHITLIPTAPPQWAIYAHI